MFRSGLRLVQPLANPPCSRGMASLQTIKAKLNSVNIQEIKQSIKTVSAKFAVELVPPTPFEVKDGVVQAARLVRSSNWKNLTVREAWLNTLVATEVACWFFVGECIGKGTLIGYQV